MSIFRRTGWLGCNEVFPPEVQMRCLILAFTALSVPAFAQISHPGETLNNTLRMNQGLIDFAFAGRRDAERKAQILEEVSALMLADLRIRSAYAVPVVAPVFPTLMDPATFQRFFREMSRGNKGTNDRLRWIVEATSRHFFSVDQLLSFLSLFSFSEEQITVAAMAYDRLVDPENFDLVYSALPFEVDRRELALRIAR